MKTRVIIASICIVIAVTTLIRLNVIRAEGGGGYVLWKGDEAYLFMLDRQFGYSISLLGYVSEPVKGYFHAPAMPTDEKWNLTIIRLTAGGIERRDQELTSDITDFTPVGNTIYAHCPGGVCKLAGSGLFQLISDQEEQNMGGEKDLAKVEFSDLNGWSRRGIKGTAVSDVPQTYEFSIKLGVSGELLVRGTNPVSVDLSRSGRASERIWYHEQRTRRVRATEYKELFRRR